MYNLLVLNEYDEMIGKVYETRQEAAADAEKITAAHPERKVYILFGAGVDGVSLFENQHVGGKYTGKPWGKPDTEYMRQIREKFQEYRYLTSDYNMTFERFAFMYEREKHKKENGKE